MCEKMSFKLLDYKFEDYLVDANRAENVDDLFSVLMKAVGQHGLNRAVFALMSDHVDIGQKADFGIVCSYPESWMSYYHEKDFKQIDPVTICASMLDSGFLWDDIPRYMVMTKQQHNLMAEAADAALYNGVGVPLHGPRNQIAGFGFSCQDKVDAFDGNIDMVAAYANHFYVAYKRILKKDNPAPIVSLTMKEREVLKWVAAGKTDPEIAFILNISRNTVDAHLRKIFKKLDSNSRVLAAVKAITLGLVQL